MGNQAPTPRDILRLEYRDLNVHDLRMELHRVDMLLRDIEASRKSSAAAPGEACQDVAGTHDGAYKEAKGRSGASATGRAGAGDDPAKSAEEYTDGSWKGRVGEGTQTRKNAIPELGGDALGKGAGSDDAVDCAMDPGNCHAVVAEAGGSVGGKMDTVSAFWAAVAAGISRDEGEQQQQRQQEEEEGEGELPMEEVDGEYGGAGDSPLAQDASYESLSVPLRVAILSALCEDCSEQEYFRARVIVSTVMVDVYVPVCQNSGVWL